MHDEPRGAAGPFAILENSISYNQIALRKTDDRNLYPEIKIYSYPQSEKRMKYSSEIPVIAKRRVVKHLCKDVCMLIIRLDMSNNKLPLKNKLPRNVVSCINML